jgi:hypothetical protein
MERVALPKGTSYHQAKVYAGVMMTNDPSINSVRVVVEKDTNKMWIEFTEFPPTTVDKLMKL